MTSSLTLYEIEHEGDEQHALEALHKAGATNIRVRGRDYEGAEAIAVSFDIPAVDVGDLKAKLDAAGVIY